MDGTDSMKATGSRHDAPGPRDLTDAAILRENDGFLRSIEDSARRELAQIEQALARVAREPGVS